MKKEIAEWKPYKALTVDTRLVYMAFLNPSHCLRDLPISGPNKTSSSLLISYYLYIAGGQFLAWQLFHQLWVYFCISWYFWLVNTCCLGNYTIYRTMFYWLLTDNQFRHIYFTPTANQVLTTYFNHYRFCFLGTKPVPEANKWANENPKVDICSLDRTIMIARVNLYLMTIDTIRELNS